MDTKQLKAMSLEEAQNLVGTAIYDASRPIEELERAGRISGNGHHLRQRIDLFARELVKERWILATAEAD